MKKVVLFGECMVELKQTSTGTSLPVTMQQAFAGDVFNAAVYMHRCFKQIDVQLFSALGHDEYSQNMKRYFAQQGVGTDLIMTSPDKIPGLYSIQTDGNGERSFTYWRNDAAARYTIELMTSDIVEQLKQCDMFVFSGISLAVIKPEFRHTFWLLIEKLKAKGVEIVFDPNYRQRLWQSVEETKAQYQLALQHSDIVLPGIEDFEVLYGLNTFEQVVEFCQGYDINELVIKDGPNGVFIVHQGQTQFVEVKPVFEVVDTTSAGDSFNGVYLGARIQGESIHDAAIKAASVAGFVIQHAGAIVPSSTFEHFAHNL